MSDQKKITKLESLINGCDKFIKHFSNKEESLRDLWLEESNRFLRKASDVANLNKGGIQKAKNFKVTIASWFKGFEKLSKRQQLEEYLEARRLIIFKELLKELTMAKVTEVEIDKQIAIERNLLKIFTEKMFPEYPRVNLDKVLAVFFQKTKQDVLMSFNL